MGAPWGRRRPHPFPREAGAASGPPPPWGGRGGPLGRVALRGSGPRRPGHAPIPQASSASSVDLVVDRPRLRCCKCHKASARPGQWEALAYAACSIEGASVPVPALTWAREHHCLRGSGRGTVTCQMACLPSLGGPHKREGGGSQWLAAARRKSHNKAATHLYWDGRPSDTSHLGYRGWNNQFVLFPVKV